MQHFKDVEAFTRDWDDPLLVTFNYYPGFPGSMYKSNGDPGDPPEDAEIEFISAFLNGEDVLDKLSPRGLEDIREECLEYAEEDDYPDEEDYHFDDEVWD